MLLTALVLASALTPEDRDLEPEAREAAERAAQPEAEWLPPGRPIAEVKVNDDARVKRFVGALAGGVVGAGVTMAFSPLTGGGGVPFLTTGQSVIGLVTPLTTIAGAFLGYQLMGGDGALLAPVLALVPAGLATALLLFTVPTRPDSVSALLPTVLTGLVLLAAGSALVLDQRQRQLEGLGAARTRGMAGAGRVLAETVLNLLALAATTATVALAIALGSGTTVAGAIGISLGIAGTAGSAAVTWATHRGLGGKGSYASAIIGVLAGLGGGLLVTLVAALSSPGLLGFGLKGNVAALLSIEVPVLAGVLVAPIALEWSHTSSVGAAEGPAVSLGGSPMPGGAMLTAGLRF
jgi:hypothetical protein